MPFGNILPDKTLLKNVQQRLSRLGAGTSNRVTANVRSGEVTMSGTIAYEHERRNILKAASTVSGVRRVIDQLRLEKKKNNFS